MIYPEPLGCHQLFINEDNTCQSAYIEGFGIFDVILSMMHENGLDGKPSAAYYNDTLV